MNGNVFQKNKLSQKGFSIVEILVSVSIFAAIIVFIGGFQSDVFSLNRMIQSGLQSQSEAKKIIRPFANEVRSASVSNLGSYPVAETASTSFSFYTDLDKDGLKEKVKYFLDNGEFKKSVISPTGQPLTYNQENEQIIKVVQDVINYDIFEYYDSSYDGTASSTALSQPVTTSAIRLVKVTLIIDSDPNKPPSPIEVTTQVSIRNLKDNL